MDSIERATPHYFGAEDVLLLAAKVQAIGYIPRGEAADIKALFEAAEETGGDFVVSFGSTGYYAVRQGGSRSQPVHWALVYYDAPDSTGTQRRRKRSTIMKPLWDVERAQRCNKGLALG